MPDDLQARIDKAAPGAEVEVPAGRWSGGLVISKPIRLIGQGDEHRRSVIDGGGKHPGISVRARPTELSFYCRNLYLINGRGPQGGGLCLDGAVDASIVNCTIEDMGSS